MLKPSLNESNGSGTRRLYSFNDLVRLHFVQALQKAGWSTQKIRKALDHLDKFISESQGFKTISLVSGKNFILALCETQEKQQVLLDVLHPGGQQVLWIVLETLRDEAQKNADRVLSIFEANDDSTSMAV